MGQSTADFYDNMSWKAPQSGLGARAFSLHVARPYHFYEQELKHLNQPKDSRFLDLGCGTGLHSIYPATLGYRVTGIDVSEASLERAKKLASERGLGDRCQFHLMSAEEIETLDQKFDVIFCSGVLYYLDLKKTFPKIIRCLKPGGHFFSIETNGENQLMNGIRKIKQLSTGYRDEQTLSHLLTLEKLNSLEKHFSHSHIHAFDATTLLGALIPVPGLDKAFHSMASQLDDLLLNQWGVKRLAFKFLLHGEKARGSQA